MNTLYAIKPHLQILKVVGNRDGIEPGRLINIVCRQGFAPQAVRDAIDELLETKKLDFHIERYGIAYRLPEGGA